MPAAAVAAAVLGASTPSDTGAEAAEATCGTAAVSIELRAWQHVDDGSRVVVTPSAAERGRYTRAPVPLALDDGFSSGCRFRYRDATVEIPRPDWISQLLIEARIGQGARDDRGIPAMT